MVKVGHTAVRFGHAVVSVGHMVATTIMRWQLSEALLRRSGATRERWVWEN